jgi:hypothetical protein
LVRGGHYLGTRGPSEADAQPWRIRSGHGSCCVFRYTHVPVLPRAHQRR